MKITKIITLIVIGILITGCGTAGVVKMKGDITAGYIPNRVNLTNPIGSFGTSFFDVTKRVGISTIYEKEKFSVKYLSEEQPDAGLSIIKDLTAKISASKGKDLSATIEATNKITSTLEKITTKSFSLNLLRSAMYRLNEAAYNGFIENKEYKELYSELIKATTELQKEEFQIINKKEEIKKEEE